MNLILDKQEMYRRLNAGKLGQTLPAAETFEDARRLLQMPGLFAVRTKQAGGKCTFNLTADEAMEIINRIPANSWNLSPMLDDTKRVCYGHLHDDHTGWNLHYSDDEKPCRLKIADGCKQKNITGIIARVYLQTIMDGAGWENLNRLIEEYPNHVIEFTVMASSLDAFGPSNVIFWEVREGLTGRYERNSAWGN